MNLGQQVADRIDKQIEEKIFAEYSQQKAYQKAMAEASAKLKQFSPEQMEQIRRLYAQEPERAVQYVQGYQGQLVSPTPKEEKTKMAVYRVTATVTVFRKNEDGTSQKIERLVTQQAGIVAASKEAAILIAGQGLQVDREVLSTATITVD